VESTIADVDGPCRRWLRRMAECGLCAGYLIMGELTPYSIPLGGSNTDTWLSAGGLRSTPHH